MGLIAHLILKRKYFKLIDEGKKKIEFRDNTAYWQKRIVEKWNPLENNIVVFHEGYTKKIMRFHIDAIIVSKGQIELHLGERIDEKVMV